LLLGLTLGQSLIRFKEYERTVTVKGLSERNVPADTALWPVTFAASGNELSAVYTQLEKDSGKVRQFLLDKGFRAEEITLSAPNVNDKGQYADDNRGGLRYYATQTATVYTKNIDLVRAMNTQIAELGKQGVGVGGGYQSTDYHSGNHCADQADLHRHFSPCEPDTQRGTSVVVVAWGISVAA
jgi:hypothetical protein